MDVAVLKAEITSDPLARGYAAMTDEQAANSLNARDRTALRQSVPTSEVFEAIVPSEYDALTAAQKTRVNLLLGLGAVQVNGANAQATLLGAFGAGTQTRANLVALAREATSRWEELRFNAPGTPKATAGDIARARVE